MAYIPSKARVGELAVAGAGIVAGNATANWAGDMAGTRLPGTGLVGILTRGVAKFLVSAGFFWLANKQKQMANRFLSFAGYGAVASIVGDVYAHVKGTGLVPFGARPYYLPQARPYYLPQAYSRPARPGAGVSVGPQVRTHSFRGVSVGYPRTQVAV